MGMKIASRRARRNGVASCRLSCKPNHCRLNAKGGVAVPDSRTGIACSARVARLVRFLRRESISDRT